MPNNNEPYSADLRLNHFKDGYKNAQESIRFIDTKTGAITGLIMLTTAMPFGVLKWSASLDDKFSANYQRFHEDHHFTYLIVIVGSILGVVLGVCGVAFGVEGLSPRSPKRYYQGLRGSVARWWDVLHCRHKKKNDNPPVTVLFPFYKEKDEVAAKKYFHNAARQLSERKVLAEYESQIAQVGRILSLKIAYIQRAAFCFRMQLWTYLITAILAYISVTYYPL